jgi:hypothetical protein
LSSTYHCPEFTQESVRKESFIRHSPIISLLISRYRIKSIDYSTHDTHLITISSFDLMDNHLYMKYRIIIWCVIFVSTTSFEDFLISSLGFYLHSEEWTLQLAHIEAESRVLTFSQEKVCLEFDRNNLSVLKTGEISIPPFEEFQRLYKFQGDAQINDLNLLSKLLGQKDSRLSILCCLMRLTEQLNAFYMFIFCSDFRNQVGTEANGTIILSSVISDCDRSISRT